MFINKLFIMKKIILFISFIFVITVFVNAQSKYIDSRLYVAYSEEFLNEISINNPNELKFLNWSLDNSFTIIEMGVEKCENLPYLRYMDVETKTIGGDVESIDVENFNIYLYSFERKHDKASTYRIGSEGYAIVFLSEKKVVENYNKYQYEK